MKDRQVLLQTRVDSATHKKIKAYCDKQVPPIKPAFLLRKLVLDFLNSKK